MAKGQMRGNKEVKKPKKDKSAAVAPIGTFLSQMKHPEPGKPK